MSTGTELHPSKLGTRAHWDSVYEEELTNFEELGDEGEIWFGVETVEKMVDWTVNNVPHTTNPSILEVGCGNGVLLLALSEAGYTATCLSGIDYSPCAIKLAKSIAATRGESISFYACDFLNDDPHVLSHMKEGAWDLLLDKGTFDAIALGAKDENGRSPAISYPGRVKNLLKPGGCFLITTCNFTEDELQAQFATAETGLVYHSRIQHPTYTFGGKEGSICSSVAFQKPMLP